MKKSFKQYVAAILIAGTILLGLGAAAHAEPRAPGTMIAADMPTMGITTKMVMAAGSIVGTEARSTFLFTIGEPSAAFLGITFVDPTVIGGVVIVGTMMAIDWGIAKAVEWIQ